MIVYFIVPLFPRTCKAPLIAWEVGKEITLVCFCLEQLLHTQDSAVKACRGSDDTSSCLVQAHLQRHFHQPWSVLSCQVTPHNATQEKRAEEIPEPLFWLLKFPTPLKGKGHNLPSPHTHRGLNPRSSMPKSRAVVSL